MKALIYSAFAPRLHSALIPPNFSKVNSLWNLKNTFSCYLHETEFLLQHTRDFSSPNKPVRRMCLSSIRVQEITNEQLKDLCYI